MSGPVLGIAIAGFAVLSALVTLLAAVITTTLLQKPPGHGAGAGNTGNTGRAEPETEPEAALLGRLSGAIAIPTVSAAPESRNDAAFREFIAYLEKTWPLFHAETERVPVSEFTLLFRLRGSGPGLEPLILTAHYDVVPVEEEPPWTWPGFSGRIDGGRVWGRGTLDVKSQLCAHLEAVENLLRTGWRPRRDFYFIYGHDEESGGREGAEKAAEYLAGKGVSALAVLDEGGFVVSGTPGGSATPLALVGVAEKGFCTCEIVLEGAGGHSAMPPRLAAISAAAALIRDIEKSSLPLRLTGPVLDMLRAGGGGFFLRMALANLWLFRPLLLRILASRPATRAMIASTLAVTMIRAGSAPNVIPQSAVLAVNARLLPGDSLEMLRKHLERLAAKAVAASRRRNRSGRTGPGFSIRMTNAQEASAVSPARGTAWDHLKKTVREFFPGAIVSPYLVMGGTDARKYQSRSTAIYRFTPLAVTGAERNSVHGIDESISAAGYARMIAFFERFIGSFDAGPDAGADTSPRLPEPGTPKRLKLP